MLNEKKSRPPGRERKVRRKGGLGQGDGSREDSSREDSRLKGRVLDNFPKIPDLFREALKVQLSSIKILEAQRE